MEKKTVIGVIETETGIGIEIETGMANGRIDHPHTDTTMTGIHLTDIDPHGMNIRPRLHATMTAILVARDPLHVTQSRQCEV